MYAKDQDGCTDQGPLCEVNSLVIRPNSSPKMGYRTIPTKIKARPPIPKIYDGIIMPAMSLNFVHSVRFLLITGLKIAIVLGSHQAVIDPKPLFGQAWGCKPRSYTS